MDHFISRYSIHAWNKIQGDSRRECSRCFGSPDVMPYQAITLSIEELERLQEAFFDFEIQRHHLAYDKLLLHQTQLQQGMLLPIYNEKSFPAGHQEDDGIEGSCLSIFCFIFQCYGELIRQVDEQLELEMPRQTLEPLHSELALATRFRGRTRNEELRYIALLCLQGYVCLRIAEKYTDGDLRIFILNSFMWFCKGGQDHMPDPDEMLRIWAGLHFLGLGRRQGQDRFSLAYCSAAEEVALDCAIIVDVVKSDLAPMVLV
uniref:Uncharacterized protein n=1 Tax=Fusarium oxysporum (strain Fo5176) TaxID=660025 RepID=A0A0D2YAR4_FUSOF